MLQTFQGVDVFFHSPMYGGMCTLPYHVSMLGTAVEFMRRGIHWRVHPLGGESLVNRARNILTAEFLRTPATHMMCVDADIGWDAADMLRLIAADKDIAVGVYPKKCYPASWPMNHFQRVGGALVTDPETNYIDIKDAPTGFMLIKRNVIERLIELHPERKCNLREGGAAQNEFSYNLFDGFIDEATGMYLSEDYGFCRLAQAAGFRVWCDPQIRLTHSGLNIFDHGCVADHMVLDNIDINTEIEGWMSVPELTWLHSTAKSMGSVVEIGCWKGRSTYALASGCAGTVYAVDHWQGSEGERDGAHSEAADGDVFAQFMENVGHRENVQVLRGSSVAIAAAAGYEFDMVFIDAGHTYEEVKDDIWAWRNKAQRIICGHDYNWPGVKQAVDEAFGAKVIFPAGSIWAVWL